MKSFDQQPATGKSQPPKRRKARWIIWRLARSAIFIWLALSIAMFALQNYLIFPGRSTQGAQHAVIRESPHGNYELIHLTTSRGDRTVALFGAASDERGRPLADASSRPTLLFFYGNAMCLADCFGLMDNFRELGINVMVAEYVGYGMSSGKPSETTLYETADACWDHLQTRTDIDRSKIIVGGWSLGAGVAIDLAVRKPVIGLATFSAFTSMAKMARKVVPFLPTSLMLRHRFDNVEKIRQIKVPIFIVHGSEDRIIPFTMMDQLAKAATSSPRVTTISVPADHNDMFETQEAVYEPMRKFIDSLR